MKLAVSNVKLGIIFTVYIPGLDLASLLHDSPFHYGLRDRILLK